MATIHCTEPKDFQVGDLIKFYCNGKGRGGHYRVFAVVTKVNRKTVRATERKGSYCPGMQWIVSINSENPAYKEVR